MEISFLLKWIACKMVFWYYVHVMITMLPRGRLVYVVWTLVLDFLITFTERIFGRHVDVGWTFNEGSDKRPTYVDWISFWTLEGRRLNVRPDVHPTLYGRMYAQWVGWMFNERSDYRPTDVDWITFWTLEVHRLNLRSDVQATWYAHVCAQRVHIYIRLNWFQAE